MKIKAWKLKDPIKRRMFEGRVSDRIKGTNTDHAGFSNALLNFASLLRESMEETERKRNMMVE